MIKMTKGNEDEVDPIIQGFIEAFAETISRILPGRRYILAIAEDDESMYLVANACTVCMSEGIQEVIKDENIQHDRVEKTPKEKVN